MMQLQGPRKASESEAKLSGAKLSAPERWVSSPLSVLACYSSACSNYEKQIVTVCKCWKSGGQTTLHNSSLKSGGQLT